jgi:DNA-binding response OmpR family regulator
MELRPHLHRVYVAQHYLKAHAAAMHQLGFRRLPDADVDFDSGSNVVDVEVRALRTKLGERAALIEAVRGTGYRLRAGRAAGAPA